MKPISPFGFGLMFIAKIGLKKLMISIGALHNLFFSLQQILAQTSAEISPPQTNIPGYVPA